MPAQFTIGLDYGTNSVRALIVNVANGKEVASAVWGYEHGTDGVILSRDPNLARQHPADYVRAPRSPFKQALAAAKEVVRGFEPRARSSASAWIRPAARPCRWIAKGQPLAFQKKFAKNPAAMAWLWKDHTGVAEAAEITALAKKIRPQYLAKCGGTYSSEWFWSKILHCLRTAPGSVRRRPFLGRTRRLCSRGAHRHRIARDKLHRRASAPPATKRCGTPPGAAIPTKSSCRKLDPSWAHCATG